MRWRGIKSQNQLARLSGVQQSTIQRILARGEHYAPQRITLTRLAQALNTTVPWLSDGVSVTPYPPPPSEPGHGHAELLQLLYQLPSPLCCALVTLLRQIAALNRPADEA